MLTGFIIGISVLIQLITVFFALKLIKVTGGIKAWIYISVAIGLMGARRIFSLLEIVVKNPLYKPDLSFELLGLVTSLLMLTGVILIAPLFETVKQAEENQRKLVNELKDALVNVKTLSGMLPICASCKKIRDDKGYWKQIETYISGHSEVLFSHGLCPDCAKKAYQELDELKEKDKKEQA